MNATDQMKPFVSINGTDRESLVKQRIEITRLLQDVLSAMGRMTPHGRDYQSDTADLERDRAIHFARINYISELSNAITAEALEIQREGY
jgi:hypothetical protein